MIGLAHYLTVSAILFALSLILAAQVAAPAPAVDGAVWVVDPEKYADASLHDRYLRPLAPQFARWPAIDALEGRVEAAQAFVPGGEGVAGVEAHPEPRGVVGEPDDPAQLGQFAPERRALPGGVLEPHPHRAPGQVGPQLAKNCVERTGDGL